MVNIRLYGISFALLAFMQAGAHPASAQVLLNDNFDSENGGAGQLNYTGFANWNVTSGDVDLIGNGFDDFIPGNGLYVDLAGDQGGTLTSKTDFTLDPGVYELRFDLGRLNVDPADNATVSLGNVYSENFQLPGTAAFTTFTRDITIASGTTGFLSFAENNLNTNTGDYLDNVSLTKLPAAVPESSTTLSFSLLLALGLGGMIVARKKAVKA